MSLFDLGIWSGKMCREPSQAENQKEQILRESSKKSVVYRRSPYLYLDRRTGHGLLPGLFWDRNSLLLGGYWTLNFGESPRDAEESSLSQILEATVPERYYLSPKACGGIIRRAGNRGKSCRRSWRRHSYFRHRSRHRVSDGSGRTADGCVPEPYRYTSGTQFKHTAHYHGEQSGKCRNRDRILSDHYSSGRDGRQ